MIAQNQSSIGNTKPANSLLSENFNVNKVFYTLLFSSYLALVVIYYIWQFNFIFFMPTLLGLVAFIFLSRRIRKEYAAFYIFCCCIMTAFLLSSIIVGRTGSRLYSPIFFIISSLGIALILIRRYVYTWGVYIVFYMCAAYFFILILSGYDGRSALQSTSYNGISIIMLTVCISLYIVQYTENKKADLIPALLTFVISIWGIGRSGIISSFILILGILFLKLRSKPRNIFFIFPILLSGFLFFNGLHSFVINNSFFSNAIETCYARLSAVESPRLNFWSNYYNNLDSFRLFWGVNVVEDPWPDGVENDYNYHNSYINLHLQTGIVGLFAMALIILALLKFYKTNKLFFFLLLSLVVRSSTDLLLFFNRFDFIPFFFIFYYLNNSFHVFHFKQKSAVIIDKSK